MTLGRRRAAAKLLLLMTPALGSCASDTKYEAPGGRLSVVVTVDTDPPDQIWQISSQGAKEKWSVGCLSDDGSGGTFRDIRWIDTGSFDVITSEGSITVKVNESGKPAVAGRDLALRPCS